MALTVDIDPKSGFCAGVIRAISKAENILAADGKLCSLGAIVHNEQELARLESEGLETVNDLDEVSCPKVLIRAHGEPPATYRKAEEKGIEIVDCTCPVVLKLQKKIRSIYEQQCMDGRGQILIFGKIGHAEVLGLVGQTDGNAVVVENLEMLDEALADGRVDLNRPLHVFSQTTKSPSEYDRICRFLKSNAPEGLLKVHDTICVQVASRHKLLIKFAIEHDVIIFVSGNASSNGRVLFDLCYSHNIRTYHVASEEDIKEVWFRPDDRVGVCGATSTPKWLLESVANKILQIGR